MRKTYIKILSFILCLIMLSAVATFAVSAEAKKNTYVEWKLAADASYITDGEKVYEKVSLGVGDFFDMPYRVMYANTVEYEGETYNVYGNSMDPSVITVLHNGYGFCYADKEGKEGIEKMLERTECRYMLKDEMATYGWTELDSDFVESLDRHITGGGQKLRIDVTVLEDLFYCELDAYDPTLSVSSNHGMLFYDDETVYYVNLLLLENNQVDADGNLSFRSGSINVAVLTKDLSEKAWEAVDDTEPMEYYTESEYYFNDDIEYDDDYKIGAIVTFFVIVVLLGIIAPIPLIIVGFVLASAKKTCKAKCWYALSISAIVWLVAAILYIVAVVI